MTKLISPAPYGWANLSFGATSPKPYSPSRPHQGRDWGWYKADITRSRRVVAPVSGTVERVYSGGGYNEGWGNRIVIRVNSRVTSILNHLLTGSITVRQGQWINAGDYVAQMGATGETYGAVHLHEELYVDGKRVDPDYYRSHDLPGTEGSGAGGGGTPLPPKNTKEDSMTQAIVLNNAHYYTVGEEFISHNGTQDQATITRLVNSASDELHRLGTKGFLDYLDGMGIPRDVVDLSTGAVLNPQSGKFEGNGVWSRRREAVAKLDKLLAK